MDRVWHSTLVAAVLLSVALARCGGPGDDGRAINKNDAGTMVEMKVGRTLKVKLDGNPSTGFNWEVKTINDAVLRQQGEPEFKADRDVPGSPGIVTLTFEAVAAGSTTLELIYRRSFEPDVPPADTFQVTVSVG